MPFITTEITNPDESIITSTFDPVTNAYSFTVLENSIAGAVIGKIAFDGGGPGDLVLTMLGDDRAQLRLAPDGTLSLGTEVSVRSVLNVKRLN
tara:strand:- start:355 stop:633 length:279 start_codon:yes stop_codon:yes gene_type:complete